MPRQVKLFTSQTWKPKEMAKFIAAKFGDLDLMMYVFYVFGCSENPATLQRTRLRIGWEPVCVCEMLEAI